MRRMMVAIGVGAVLSLAVRSAECGRTARRYERMSRVCRCFRPFYSSLADQYRRAARYPWLPITSEDGPISLSDIPIDVDLPPLPEPE